MKKFLIPCFLAFIVISSFEISHSKQCQTYLENLQTVGSSKPKNIIELIQNRPSDFLNQMYDQFGDKIFFYRFIFLLKQQDFIFIKLDSQRLNGRKLIQIVRLNFGTSWPDFVSNYASKVLKKKLFGEPINMASVVDALKKLNKYYSLNTRSIREIKVSQIFSLTGLKISGRDIFDYVTKNNEWSDFLKKHNLNRISKDSLNDAIVRKALSELNIFYELNSDTIKRMTRDEVYARTKLYVAGRELYDFVRVKLKTKWTDYLAINNLTKRPYKRLRVSKKNEVVALILILSKLMNLNVSNVIFRSKSIFDNLALDEKLFVSGISLYRTAVKDFGSWDGALVAAGLNPDEIRLRGLARFADLSDELKSKRKEDIAEISFDIGFDQQRPVQITKVTAVDILIQHENDQAIDGVISDLTESEGLIFEHMINLFENHKLNISGLNSNSALSHLIAKLTESYEIKDVESLLNKLRSNPILINLFGNPKLN